jgi:hypothetical protein
MKWLLVLKPSVKADFLDGKNGASNQLHAPQGIRTTPTGAVRPDGKIDLSLEQTGHRRLAPLALRQLA